MVGKQPCASSILSVQKKNKIIALMNPAFENKIRGTYCQFIDGKQIRFLEIHACEYDLDKIARILNSAKK